MKVLKEIITLQSCHFLGENNFLDNIKYKIITERP